MTRPDPFAPPSGVVPPEHSTLARAQSVRPEPRYGALAPPGPSPAPTVPAVLAGAPTGLAAAASVLAVVWTVLQLGFFLTSLAAVEPYEAALAARRSLMTVVTPYDSLAVLAFPVQVAMFVVGCLWLQQGRRLAAALSPSVRQVRRPVWVWLGWVVPFVFLWFPYQVVRDVRAAAVGGTASRRLGWWWACWLVGLWSSNQASLVSMGLRATDPEVVPVFEGISFAATAAACALWVGLVHEITRGLQTRLAPVL
ncbi:DUF4328 domain-containing protein [Isoptericola sp. NPDC055881]